MFREFFVYLLPVIAGYGVGEPSAANAEISPYGLYQEVANFSATTMEANIQHPVLSYTEFDKHGDICQVPPGEEEPDPNPEPPGTAAFIDDLCEVQTATLVFCYVTVGNLCTNWTKGGYLCDGTSANGCGDPTHVAVCNGAMTQGTPATNNCTYHGMCTSRFCTGLDACTYDPSCTRDYQCTSGGKCTIGRDCTGGLSCTGGNGGTNCTTGNACTAFKCTKGQACTGGANCTKPAVCTSGPNCTNNECTDGPVCTRGPVCSKTTYNNKCTATGKACKTAPMPSVTDPEIELADAMTSPLAKVLAFALVGIFGVIGIGRRE